MQSSVRWGFYFSLRVFLIVIFLQAGIVLPGDGAVSEDVFKVLEECAEKNTCFLKGKISEESITAFKEYAASSLQEHLPFALFSYDARNKSWKIECFNYLKEAASLRYKTTVLKKWLKHGYKPSSNFKFIFFPEEPYYNGWYMDAKKQERLGLLLEKCPALISCIHPDLAWSRKAVLVPDIYLLKNDFQMKIKKLLESEIVSLEKKGCEGDVLLPFTERKSKVFFRGALSGPKLPFFLENFKQNPRHYLLFRLHDFPYVDVGITNFLKHVHKIDLEYYLFLQDNFSHLRALPVDFFEHAKNKYLFSFDGFGAAWSRPQLIMATGSVLFFSTKCEQYFYPLMENNKTHVMIDKYFNNLDYEFRRLEENPELAEKIGAQGREFARNFFSREAIDTYLWLVLNKLENA